MTATAVLITYLVGGCLGGSLASNTGPRPPLCEWSTANRQEACIGEEVRFDFVLTDMWGDFVHAAELADYLTVFLGEERLEAESDLHGHFPFSYKFDHVKPGDRVTVRAIAYRQQRARDFMKVAGQWTRSESPYEIADEKVASDSIELEVYQAPILLSVPQPALPLDPSTGVLRIRRSDGSTVSVFVATRLRPGFTLTEPGPDGVFEVRYIPRGNELNATGQTEVELLIYDKAGHPYRASATIDTP